MEINQSIKQQLINYFQQQSIITMGDFRNYFRAKQPSIKDTTIRGRIHDLKQAGLVQSAGRGKYTFQTKATFQPMRSPAIKKVATLIHQHFDIDYCISSTEWLGEFSLHQAFQHILLLEVEKEFLRDTFDVIRNNSKQEVYLSPDKKIFDLYVSSADSPIVLKALPGRAPIKEVSNTKVSSLEKMLVDLFVDEQTFYAYQGQEMVHIFEKAIQLYQLDYSRLFGYAARRKKKKGLQQFLKETIINFPKEL